MYFGYYFGLRDDTRKEILVAGDGPIAWTSIADMAYATAKVLNEPSEKWAGKTFYLSQKKTWTLQDISSIVSDVRGQGEKVKLKIVSRKEYEDFYVNEKGIEKQSVEWWSSTYDALEDGECAVDDPTLQNLLGQRKPASLEDTVRKMMANKSA